MPTMSDNKRAYMIEALGLPSNTTMSNTDLETRFWTTTTSSGSAYKYGFNAKKLPKWSKAMARVLDNAGDAKILTIGDSQFFGVGSTGYATFPATGSPMARLSAKIAAGGVPSSHGLITPGVDNRWTVPGNWTSTLFGIGSLAAYVSAPNAGALVCTDARTVWDRCDVYYLQGPGLGTIACTATGGSAVNGVGANGVSSVQRVTALAAAPSTANTISIVSSVANSYVVGVEFWLNGTSKVRVGNGGVGTVGIQQHVTPSQISTWGTIPVMNAYGPDLVITGIGINDRLAGRTVNQFIADMTTFINAVRAGGYDLIIASEAPAGSAPSSTNEAQYNQAMADLATQFNAPYYAYCERCQSYATYNALGMMFDATHPNNLGYWDWANGLAPSLLAV